MTAAEETISRGYVRVSRAADIIGTDTTTIYRLFAKGTLSGFSVDGLRLIELASVMKYLQQRESRARKTATVA